MRLLMLLEDNNIIARGEFMISFKQSGNFNKTEKFLKRAPQVFDNILNLYAQEGVRALAEATPIDSGETSTSWTYSIEKSKRRVAISWTNTNVVNGVNIALILQYGHGTRNGGYVQGRDYINPAIKPVFDRMLNELWREVANL